MLQNTESAPNNTGEKRFNFNFKPQDFAEDITKKTKVDFDNKENSNQQTENKEPEKQEKKKEESKTKLESSAYSEFADFLIEGLDGGVSALSMFIAKESSSKQFQAEEEKKIKLKNQLSKILEKHNFGIGIEFLFFISLLMAYTGKVRKSITLRAENEKKEKEKRERIEKQNNVIKNDIVEDIEVEEEKPKQEEIKEKAKVGRKSKADEERERKERLDRLMMEDESSNVIVIN